MRRTTKYKKVDEVARIIGHVLEGYREQHPKASVNVYRQNPVSIRIRIIDPDFRGLDRVDREKDVWRILDELPADVRGDITLLLLLTPEEKPDSLANVEFEHPLPSRL